MLTSLVQWPLVNLLADLQLISLVFITCMLHGQFYGIVRSILIQMTPAGHRRGACRPPSSIFLKVTFWQLKAMKWLLKQKVFSCPKKEKKKRNFVIVSHNFDQYHNETKLQQLTERHYFQQSTCNFMWVSYVNINDS